MMKKIELSYILIYTKIFEKKKLITTFFNGKRIYIFNPKLCIIVFLKI